MRWHAPRSPSPAFMLCGMATVQRMMTDSSAHRSSNVISPALSSPAASVAEPRGCLAVQNRSLRDCESSGCCSSIRLVTSDAETKPPDISASVVSAPGTRSECFAQVHHCDKQ